MDTGVGMLIEVQAIIAAETRSYPASHRYKGVILTPADETIPFVTDNTIPESARRAICRPQSGIIEVADFIETPEGKGN